MIKKLDIFSNRIYFLYIVLFLFMLVRHMSVQIGVGDDIWFLEKSNMGILNYTVMRIETWTSRNLIEFFMLVLLNLNKWIWIIIDSMMFVLIYHSIIKISGLQKKCIGCIVIMCTIILFPFNWFGETGWYATTLNYVWPLGLGLYCISYLTDNLANKHSRMKQILVVFAVIYASNQEQMCALIFGYYLLFLLYKIYKHGEIDKTVYLIILITFIMLLYHLLCPGNAMRKIAETQAYYPQYESFSIIDKVTLGIVSTLSIVLLKPAYIVFIWNAVLLYIIFIHKKSKLQFGFVFIFSVINIIISFSDKLLTNNIIARIFNMLIPYTSPISYVNHFDKSIYIMLTYFAIMFFGSIYILYNNIGKKISFMIGIILISAFCSRVILGFSASIYASGLRTFINSYFLIFIAAFICINAKEFDMLL